MWTAASTPEPEDRSAGSDVGSADVPPIPRRFSSRQIFEREYLTAQLNRFLGDIDRTAEFVGMTPADLRRTLKSLDLTI